MRLRNCYWRAGAIVECTKETGATLWISGSYF